MRENSHEKLFMLSILKIRNVKFCSCSFWHRCSSSGGLKNRIPPSSKFALFKSHIKHLSCYTSMTVVESVNLNVYLHLAMCWRKVWHRTWAWCRHVATCCCSACSSWHICQRCSDVAAVVGEKLPTVYFDGGAHLGLSDYWLYCFAHVIVLIQNVGVSRYSVYLTCVTSVRVFPHLLLRERTFFSVFTAT